MSIIKAIALQTRHILDEMHAKGHRIEAIYMSGSFLILSYSVGFYLRLVL